MYNVYKENKTIDINNYIETIISKLSKNFYPEKFRRTKSKLFNSNVNKYYYTLEIIQNQLKFKANKNNIEKANREPWIFYKNPYKFNKYEFVDIQALKELVNIGSSRCELSEALNPSTQRKNNNYNNNKNINSNFNKMKSNYNPNNQKSLISGNSKSKNPNNSNKLNTGNYNTGNHDNYRVNNSSLSGTKQYNYRDEKSTNFRGGNYGNNNGFRGGTFRSKSNSRNKNFSNTFNQNSNYNKTYYPSNRNNYLN